MTDYDDSGDCVRFGDPHGDGECPYEEKPEFDIGPPLSLEDAVALGKGERKCAMCEKIGEHEEWCEIQPIFYARCKNKAEQDAVEAILAMYRVIGTKGGNWLKCYTVEEIKSAGYYENLMEHAGDVLSEIIYQNTKK
jgi:hypothetical protein